MTTFTVVSADLELGTCTLAIDLPGGEVDDFTIPLMSFCTSDDNTDLQIIAALKTMVDARIAQLFPLLPKPPALLSLIGGHYDSVEVDAL